MLKLNKAFFEISPKPKYADYYENALYDHVLALIAPDNGKTTYFLSVKPGIFKTYCTHDNSFWCCTCSGIENTARYNESIYLKNDNSLWVNLYIPSLLPWREKGIAVITRTWNDGDTITL